MIDPLYVIQMRVSGGVRYAMQDGWSHWGLTPSLIHAYFFLAPHHAEVAARRHYLRDWAVVPVTQEDLEIERMVASL